ncbi:MAG: phosphatidylglycerol lysyltransferase domain-containing protein [Candidatus Woesearchaeota archaeon]
MNQMIFFEDLRDEKVKKIIEDTIQKNGCAPEHNYFELLSYETKYSKPIFVYFGDNKGLFAVDYEDVWQVLSEILAPENERADIFLMFAEYLFKIKSTEDKKIKKIMIECPFRLRKELIKKVKKINENSSEDKAEKKIVIGKVVEHYYTPIISIKSWDPELKGSEFSKLRKTKNRFLRNYNIEILNRENINNVPKEEIRNMILNWKKNRKAKDRATYEQYISFINNGFNGSEVILLLKINGKVSGLASAYKIPNSDTLYYNISLHDYSIPELGDFLTIMFFNELKAKGYDLLNFGSSDDRLLRYKNKFKPISVYDSSLFYVRYQ